MKTYKVTGGAPYKGHKPGTTFSADLDPETEARAIARGSILVDGSPGMEPANDGMEMPPQPGTDEAPAVPVEANTGQTEDKPSGIGGIVGSVLGGKE